MPTHSYRSTGTAQLLGGDLFGRAGELDQLRRAMQSTRAGNGSCMVLEGPAGIGKSRLLAAAHDMATELGLAIAMGRACEFDRYVPLGTLISALRNNSALSSDADRIDTSGGPVWLIGRISELIASYAQSQPLVITIDDAHWADELTAFALPMLVNAPARGSALWLLARRHGPAWRPAQDAIDRLLSDGARSVPLGPLDDPSIAQFCERLLGVAPDPSLLTEVARGGGNPFLVEQLVRGLRDSGQLAIEAGAAQLIGGPLPSTFLDAVGARLRDLSPDAQRLIQAGSVLGRPFSLHEVARLTGLPVTGLVPAVTETVHKSALIDSGAKLVFSHDLIREAIYDAMLSSVREALHREAAAVVEQEGGSPLEVAEHLIRGGRMGDDQATAVLRHAVDTLAATAPATAADLVLRVLDPSRTRDPSRRDLVAKTVRLLARAGRIADARTLAEQTLLEETDEQQHALLMLGLIEALKHAGQNKIAVSYARGALIRPGVPDYVRAQLLAIKAHALLRTDEFAQAREAAAEAVQASERSGNHEALVFGYTAQSCIELSCGNLDGALSAAQQALSEAGADGGEGLHWQPRLWLAIALMATDRFAEASDALSADQHSAELQGTVWSEPLWCYCQAQLSMATGRLRDALAEARKGVHLAEQSGALALHAALLALLSHICLYMHDMPSARRYIAQVRDDVRSGITVGPEELAWRLALIDEADGHPELAFRTLADVYALLPERLQLFVDDPGSGPRLVHIARQAGQDASAGQVVAALRTLSERNPGVASLRGAAAHAAGVLHNDLEMLRVAVTEYRQAPRLLALAAALEDTASAEGAAGNRARAIELLNEAADLYFEAGADRDASRVARDLARLGSRRRSRTARKTPELWAGLSESELRVVRLVAEGLTNREIADQLYLSPHTVDTHLRHSFAKLGVNSRVDLTRRVVTRDTGHARP